MPLARPIADALRRGAAVVAASPRAARALQLRYAEEQRAAGYTIWNTPAILDWDSWLRSLWQDHAFATPAAPLLLTPLQERTVWQRVQKEDAGLVLAPDAMAALAMEAWRLLSAYEAHAARRVFWEQADAERFRHWAAEFQEECRRQGWMSASQLELALAPLVAVRDSIALPAEVVLTGFDRMTPAQRALRRALEGQGIAVSDAGPEGEPAEQRRWVAANDRRHEIEACGAWVREILQENPEARIGVLAPGMSAARGQIERTFRRVLMPESEDIRRAAAGMPFEFSLGRPLAEVPAIRAALLLLRWVAEPVREEEIAWLMLSGFAAGTAGHGAALARHEAARRRSGCMLPQRSMESYRASAAGNASLRPVSDVLGRLLRSAAANQVEDQERRPSGWTELMHALLERAAWPGERSPDSVQFQALQRWQRLLDDLALLDFDGTRYSYRDFVKLLERQAGETIFAPESRDAPVQIMGPMESSGQRFDAIWFMGMDEEIWPMRGRLHPLLPPGVQRQFNLPHAAPEDHWNLAHRVTTRLLASAPRIVFSYARHDKDAELRPSPLAAGFFPVDARPETNGHRGGEARHAPQLEEVADDSGVLAWPLALTAGGAEVLRRQAACPFQAFASKRLAAEAPEEIGWGLSAADRGKLLHAVLHRLFTVSEPAPLRTRDDLVAAAGTNKLAAILEAHIDAVFRGEFGADPADLWLGAYLNAEKGRLQARLQEWLTLEAQRQPFTVEGCEQRLHDVHVGELRLNLRADRIDLLPDGSRLLIDYKTGKVAPASWEGERPKEPQLPLYAAFGNVENVSGILFAQIRAGETRFDGRVRDARNQLLSGLKTRRSLATVPYSEAMRTEWARVLGNLAAEFLAGEAAVDPREPKVCEQCGLHGLCRIAELNLASGVESGEEPADD